MTTTSSTMNTKQSVPANGLIIAAVLALIGIAAWIYQISAGMQVTGLGQQAVWGLYIAAFFTAVGSGAGLLGMVGLSEFLPVMSQESRPRVLSAALAALAAGGLLINLDLGNPLKLWQLIIGMRFSSMMTWDFWLLAISALVALVYLVSAKDGKEQKTLGVVAMAAALLVVAVEGWMLTTMAARPLWGSGMILLTFLLGAAIAALSLVTFVLPEVKNLRMTLAAALGLSLVLVVSEALTGLLSGNPQTVEEMQVLVFGSAASFFWFHLLVGLVLPLVLVLRSSSSLPLVGGLALLGVLVEKVWLLAAGQANPWLDLPAAGYFPTWVEFVAVIGMAALGFLIYRLIIILFKVK